MNRTASLLFCWILWGFVLPQTSYAYSFFVDVLDPKLPTYQVSAWPNDVVQRGLLLTMDDDSGSYGMSAFQIGERAVKHWNSVSASQMKLRLFARTVDINAKNFHDEIKIGDERYDIIIDVKGEILKSLGLDPNFVAGIGVPITKSNPKGRPQGPFGGEIIDAFVLVNTKLAWNVRTMERVITHEIGHILGLGHTNVSHRRNADELPIMFYAPTAQSGPVQLHQDDKSGFATLYPKASFEEEYGAIEGIVTRRDQSPVFGAAIIAIPTQGTTSDAIGTWSNPQGNFRLTGLPPGDYELLIRSYDPIRNDNYHKMDPTLHSSGIYRKKTQFCPEFFNDRTYRNCSLVAPTQRDQVRVRVGQTTTNVLIVEDSNNPSPPLSCRVGAAPKLPSRPHGLSEQVPKQGKRGISCRYEAPPIEQPVEMFVPDKVLSPSESPSESGDKDGVTDGENPPPPLCQCHNWTDANGGVLVVLFWFLSIIVSRRRRHTKNTSFGATRHQK